MLTDEKKREIVGEVLGVDPQALPQIADRYAQTEQEFYINNLGMEFMRRNPRFVATPENEEMLGQIIAEWVPPEQRAGYRPSLDDVERALSYAVMYKGMSLGPDPSQPKPAIPRPPVMPSGGAPTLTDGQNPWAMDMNDLKKAAGLG